MLLHLDSTVPAHTLSHIRKWLAEKLILKVALLLLSAIITGRITLFRCVVSYLLTICFPSELWHCWLGDRKGIRHVNSWVLVCCWWWFDWSFARLIAPVVTTTAIILSSNKVHDGDILISANPGPTWKMAVNMERENLLTICSFLT